MSTAAGGDPNDTRDTRNSAPTERIDEGRHAAPADGTIHDADASVRREVVAREKEAYGGVKVGAAFFGWLTAMGMAVLLTALVAGTGTAISLGAGITDPNEVDPQAATPIGIVGIIVVLLVVFIAYYCGGYVAGRMARFDGARQGVGVVLWGILIAVVLAIVGAIAGSEYNVFSQLNLPRLPVDEGTLTTGGIIALVAVVLVTLLAAIAGGKVGERFHRKVDRVGHDA